MVHFDELSYAEEMYRTQSFIKSYCVTELSIYGRWLKYKQMQEIGKDYDTLTDEEDAEITKHVRDALIEFSSKHYSEFNYTINYVEIDKAVENTKVVKLMLPKPMVITRKEYDVLMGVENDNYRRMLFIMLVDAKFRFCNNVSLKHPVLDRTKPFFVRLTRSEIIKLSGAKFTDKVDKNKNSWYYFGSHNLLEMMPSWNTVAVTFVDLDENAEVMETVTDYEHLDLHYERMIGNKIGQCAFCGRLFRQNPKNNATYCYKHRGRKRESLENQVVKCPVCGNTYVKKPQTRRNMCDDCYKEYRKKDRHKA